jgi:hypothetical protein
MGGPVRVSEVVYGVEAALEDDDRDEHGEQRGSKPTWTAWQEAQHRDCKAKAED